MESIYKTGVPTIVILINGRPLATRWIAENIPAVIEAWEPGSMGGKAIAEISLRQSKSQRKVTHHYSTARRSDFNGI
ncbi:MAG: glycoside hydrolase family 3 C-terminal domain-containing protein [Bacteroides cellulosilyticus]